MKNKNELLEFEENEVKTNLTSDDLSMVTLALMFIANIIESLVDKLEDHKLSMLEKLSLLMDLKPLLEIIGNWRQLITALKSCYNDDTAKVFIIDKFKEEFDIKNDKAEKLVEHCFAVLINILMLIEGVKMFKK